MCILTGINFLYIVQKQKAAVRRYQCSSQFVFLKLLPNSKTWMKYLRVNATFELIKSKLWRKCMLQASMNADTSYLSISY